VVASSIQGMNSLGLPGDDESTTAAPADRAGDRASGMGARESPRRPAWWMYLVAASYIITFGLIVYLIVYGPAELNGFSMRFVDATVTIISSREGSPEARAGLREGDRLVSIDARPIRTPYDWLASTANLQVGRPQRWLVARGGEHVPLDIYPLESGLRSRVAEGYIQYSTLLVSAMGVGLLIGWKRPGDAAGRLGAWFMMTASIAFGFPVGWAVPWRALPAAVQLMLWIPQVSRFVLEGIFLSFFLVFPRPLLNRRWLWVIVWAPVVATLPWRIQSFHGVIRLGQMSRVPGWILQAGFARTIVYLVVAMVVLAVSYRRLLGRSEKRRVRVLMVGTAASAVTAIALVWVDNFLGRFHLKDTTLGFLFLVLLVPFNAACPLSLAYAILRHRVLEISVIVRQGLQYMLARGAVIALVPALGVVLGVDLLLSSQQPLADVLRSHGWFYAFAAALWGLTYWKRREWLDAIDRRFFRERFDAQQVLRDVLAEVRTARDFERVAPRVVERLEAAFHPEFVSVMVRAQGAADYRSLASAPAEHAAPPPLAAETKVVGLLRVLGKPLEALQQGSTWLDQRLPREEAAFLREARLDMLVPIATGSEKAEALLALGIKRSEGPYTREDQEFLEAIAASLALLVEQPAPAPGPARERPSGALSDFRECPECGHCYESSSTLCDRDSSTLVRIGVPRILGGRYRLDRRRGQGGMGTVYEATDSELGRQVAIKLIREDWSDRVEARQRFRREARAGAGFAHPNVVTVHDYGLEADKRAYLVMELLEGVSLRDEINRHRHLLPPRVVEILRGVCSAVGAAHRQHLIHRDLKPANIFLARGSQGGGETVKVLDFGVAKFLPHGDEATPTQTRSGTHSGVLVGTPTYMSPEQLLGGTLEPAWDLWALAVVAYEALTGALPFAGSGTDWQRAVLAGSFTPLRQHRADAPAAWESFFGRCFSSDRGRRPASAAGFFEELDQALA
jgi:Protein kinase domain